MSTKKTSEETNLVIGIKNSLIKDTRFMYYPGMDYKVGKDVTEVRQESLEFKVVTGTYFTIEDYFILKEINNLGITSVSTLLKRLAVEKKRNPSKSYPDYDYQSLLQRILFLCRQGLVYSFEFMATNKKKMGIFCCTLYGWRLYKNKLKSPDLYDKNLVFYTETEVFKRVASNAVAYAFTSSPICNSVVVNETISYGNGKKGYIYARAALEDEEKAIYIIEPVYFNVDSRLITVEENEEQINTRLSQMEEIVLEFNKEHPTKLILCVENYEGLTKLLKILKNKDIKFYSDYCYYTSENVIYESGDVLSRSFLVLYVNDDKYTFRLAHDKWF